LIPLAEIAKQLGVPLNTVRRAATRKAFEVEFGYNGLRLADPKTVAAYFERTEAKRKKK